MSLNEFVLAFTSVVIGLGVTDLLSSLHRLLGARTRVKWDWLTLLYAAYMLFGLIVFWWWQYGFPREGTSLTIMDFLANFLFLALGYLMAASALPDEIPAEGWVLRDFYWATVTYRWGLLSTSIGCNLLGVIIVSARAGRMDWVIIALLSVCTTIALLALRWRSTRYHAAVLLFLFTASATGVVLAPLRP